ncbi:MAG: cobalamin-dependent protein [Candidatus Pacebacteria bacterium]|nr:cobalamin-dependent protein [Candidatus Paceibacterota bacterium]
MKLKLSDGNTWPLARFIAPVYPEVNIFTGSRITPLGLVNIATAASKIWGWRIEIIDENNYRGPCDKKGLPDHEKLQKENPASIVSFYCGLTSTMDRVFALSKFYRKQGAFNIAGGWHVHFCPDEALNNDFDVVVHGEGEMVVRDILKVLKSGNNLSNIPGISFWDNGMQKTNPPTRLELQNLSDLPYPDFGIIRYARKIKVYPIGRVRGCGMNCEFCSVKGKPRWADTAYVFNVVKWLVDTRRARRFFIVDDRLEENREGILSFFKMISDKYNSRLEFTVQIRLETAKDTELLESMRKAGVRVVCVGYESPIAEDLKAMHKGLSTKKMVEWTLILRRYFWVHGMFIFGYPNKESSTLSVLEMVKRYKTFIHTAKISSIQILHPVPLVGTELRARLKKTGRIFPLNLVPWSKYDGNYACFPPDNMSLSELQDTPIKLMNWFYSKWSFWRIPYRTLIFPIHYLITGWHHWYDSWLRDIVKYGGRRILTKWLRKHKRDDFVPKLKDYAKNQLNIQ